MKNTNISALKAHLSEYIQLVRMGEEVLICERKTPVARIVPCDSENRSAQQSRLVARGILAPPRRKYSRSAASWPVPPGKVSNEAMEQVWRQERDVR
ncbi:MAG: type II toxin-antitoxin system Phd/YefM family antitoxin [Acidobacteriaceae bacterium]